VEAVRDCPLYFCLDFDGFERLDEYVRALKKWTADAYERCAEKPAS
jgi:hypothetical protein